MRDQPVVYTELADTNRGAEVMEVTVGGMLGATALRATDEARRAIDVQP